jgi:hypothetical protein
VAASATVIACPSGWVRNTDPPPAATVAGGPATGVRPATAPASTRVTLRALLARDEDRRGLRRSAGRRAGEQEEGGQRGEGGADHFALPPSTAAFRPFNPSEKYVFIAALPASSLRFSGGSLPVSPR